MPEPHCLKPSTAIINESPPSHAIRRCPFTILKISTKSFFVVFVTSLGTFLWFVPRSLTTLEFPEKQFLRESTLFHPNKMSNPTHLASEDIYVYAKHIGMLLNTGVWHKWLPPYVKYFPETYLMKALQGLTVPMICSPCFRRILEYRQNTIHTRWSSFWPWYLSLTSHVSRAHQRLSWLAGSSEIFLNQGFCPRLERCQDTRTIQIPSAWYPDVDAGFHILMTGYWSEHHLSFFQVGWGCRIYPLLFCRVVPHQRVSCFMILNNMMPRFQ